MSTAIHTFRIQGMHCASCALLIDDTLADLPGVRSTQTSMKQSRSIVELDLGPTPADVIADVMAAVTELGYTAHHVS
ncbi:heavy metal-associated domain-containing protein [Pseudonocardia sp. MH-G8]|uniref:heavy-metal-associated domain-containing protein n=1 Tax=Pseudonocardia sp. MH-G8 TaxID=1854588 RepID=UPI001E645960|nr:heavy metal-associated domain-containing protein [Pseudonocardia sp. MH-G8]